MLRRAFMCSFLLAVLVPLCFAQQVQVTGVVFEDRDGDGQRDAGEPGIARVRVSDGLAVVLTDDQGRYSLQTSPGLAIIRVSFPDGYWPVKSFWQRIELSPGQAARADFALRRLPESEASAPLTVVQITDVHLTPKAASLFREVVQQINDLRPRFVVATGDLVMDVNRARDDAAVEELFKTYRDAVSSLNVPLFNLPGNHEMAGASNGQFPADSPYLGEGAFRRFLGPLYYSFEHAGCYFLMLHATVLNDPSQPGRGYYNGLNQRELQWLQNELRLTARKPTYIFCHQPPNAWRNWMQAEELLRHWPVVATFAGHDHVVEIRRSFCGAPVYVAGAVSGSWWGGGRKTRCPDKMPPGYLIIWIKEPGSALPCYRGQFERNFVDTVERAWDAEKLAVKLKLKCAEPDVSQVIVRYGKAAVSAKLQGEEGSPVRTAQVVLDGAAAGGQAGVYQAAVWLVRAGKVERADIGRPLAAIRLPDPVKLDGSEKAILRLLVENVDAENEVFFGAWRIGIMRPAVRPYNGWLQFAMQPQVAKGPAVFTVKTASTRPGEEVKPGMLDDFSIRAAILQVGDQQYWCASLMPHVRVGDNEPGMARAAKLIFSDDMAVPKTLHSLELRLAVRGVDVPTAVRFDGIPAGALEPTRRAKTFKFPIDPAAAQGPFTVFTAPQRAGPGPGGLDDFAVLDARAVSGKREFVALELALRAFGLSGATAIVGDNAPWMPRSFTGHFVPIIPAPEAPPAVSAGK